MCVCSLSHPACNAHVPYCHLRLVPMYSNFPPYFIKGTIFTQKTLWPLYVCFGFLYSFCLKYSKNILIIAQRDATLSNLFIILQVQSTCFGCQPHPSLELHKNCNCIYLPPKWPSWPFWRKVAAVTGNCTKNMTSAGGCSYSFVYSWWWVWLTTETCRVNLQNNK